VKKLLAIVLGASIGIVMAEETTATPAVSGSFTVFPIQVIFSSPGKVQELTLINTGKGVLNTQSKLLNYSQSMVKGRLIESNSAIVGAPSVIVTPVVVANVQPDAKQSIRLLAIKQDESKEIVYRYFIKNLVPQSVDSSGTNFEIQYGMPIFILPKNVDEKYAISYVKQNGKGYLKVANTGNVHLVFKHFSVDSGGKSVQIGSVGRLLAGDFAYIEIPAKIDATLAANKSFVVSTNKSKLIDFEQVEPLKIEVTK
jgi:P pilus assembly chaperone PapD